MLFFADPLPRPEPHIHVALPEPRDLSGLEARVRTFLSDHSNGAVVIEGAERLVAVHPLEHVAAVFGRLRTVLAHHGPLRVAFDPGRVSAAVAPALAGTVTSAGTHSALEALTNPIRRDALLRLPDRPATFSELMRSAGLDDSPKMSFHMRKLGDAGLLGHDGQLQRLTPRGSAAVELLRGASFLPPSSGTANSAFPESTDPHGRSPAPHEPGRGGRSNSSG